MTELELQALTSQGEGLHIEFKESITSNLSKEMVAFANTKGGVILIGVDDDGVIKNKSLGNGDRSKIQNFARDCDPPIDIFIEEVVNQPNVLVINIKEGLNDPYRCTTGFYVREGASSNKRKTHEIREMFMDAGRFSFDDILCPKVDFKEHFEPDLLKLFFLKAEKEQVLSDENTLHNLGVLEFVEGKPVFNNTGVLFFTKATEKFLPHAIIQCVRYKGIEKIDIEDQKDMTLDIMTNIEESFAFLRRSLDVAFKIESDQIARKEVWEIPKVALREALINAIAHRDYVNRGTRIQLEVFDDRVSITNFGGLARGFTLEDIVQKTNHRNPNIVNIFHRADYIEKLGTGILRINKELKLANLPKAEFKVNEHWFEIIFKRNRVVTSNSGTSEIELSEQDYKILSYCITPKNRVKILSFIGLVNEYKNYKRHILPLINNGFLRLTLPDKPTSKNQKYATTELGKKRLKLKSLLDR